MKVRKLAVAGVALVAVATSTSCLQPNQHTLVGISGANNPTSAVDTITFTFAQGAPSGSSARPVSRPPSGPSGQPVGVDGTAFVQVDLTPAVARDARNATTAPEAFYPLQTKNVVEVAKYEDFEGHVGYAIGLRTGPPPRLSVARTATTVVVSISARG